MFAPLRQPQPAVSEIGVLLAQADGQPRALLSWMLQDDGRFRVLDEVNCGEELISYHGDPDLLLIDLRLPGVNAHDAVERFRPRHPHCAIVVVAPTDAKYLRQAMAAAGADDYVVVAAPSAGLLDRLAELCHCR